MVNIEPTIIIADVQTKVIETEIKPVIIETEIKPTTLELFIAPAQNVTYNMSGVNPNQERLPVESINVPLYSILSHSPEGLILADCFDLATWNIAGISTESTTNGGSLLVQYGGVVTNFYWNWVLSKPIFVGRNGQMTQHPPDEAVYLAQIATPISTDSILIDIKEVIFL